MDTMTVQLVKITLIDPPAFNSRVTTTPEDDAALSSSIKTEGVKQPIKVQAVKGGRFELIFGSRRLKAASQAGLTEIPAIVKPASVDGDTSSAVNNMIDNAVENLQRRDLTTYETARTLNALREKQLKLKDIGAKCGVTESYAASLVRCYVQLHPTIVTAWKNGEPAATMSKLTEIAKMDDKEAQLKAWGVHVENLRATSGADDIDNDEKDDKDDKEDDSDDPGKKSVTKYHIDKKRYTKLIKVLSAKKAPVLVAAACKYLVGITDELPGYIDAPTEE